MKPLLWLPSSPSLQVLRKSIKIECLTRTYQHLKTIMKPNGKPPCFQLARALSVTIDIFIFLLGKLIQLGKDKSVEINIFLLPPTAAATLVYIEFFVENVKRGFFCGDKTISFRKQDDTISIKTVITFALSPILKVRRHRSKNKFNWRFHIFTRIGSTRGFAV